MFLFTRPCMVLIIKFEVFNLKTNWQWVVRFKILYVGIESFNYQIFFTLNIND